MTAPEPTPITPASVPADKVSVFAKYAKGWLALAGSVTPLAVFTALNEAGVPSLPAWAQALITLVCTVGAVVKGPKNRA